MDALDFYQNQIILHDHNMDHEVKYPFRLAKGNKNLQYIWWTETPKL